MKKKNGFTLIEMLLVVVIMAIVAAITIPSIMKMMENSKNKKYVEYENILKENLKLYNHDHNEDIWNNNQAQTLVNYQDLLKTNPDIKIDGCQVNNPGLVIDSNGSKKYTYHACITCTDENNKVIYTSSDACSYTEANAPTNPSNPDATTKLLCTVSQNNNSLSIFTNKTDSSITYSFDGKNYSKNNTLNITKSGSYTGYAKDSNNNVTSCTLSDAYVDGIENAPSLATGMIAVYYSTSDNNWHKADSTNKNVNYRWYDYENKMWANVVTVSATNRTTYLNAPLGTVIPMSDINTMFVWIPRFNAVTPSNYNGGTYSSPGAIDVKFVDINTNALDAFTFGSDQLSGFWFGKFENSATSIPSSASTILRTIIIKPSIDIWMNSNVNTFYTSIKNMQKTNNIYGLNIGKNTLFDVHMIKNNEWGVITYLANSLYGRCSSKTSCEKVQVNNQISPKTTGIGHGSDAGRTELITAPLAQHLYNGSYGVKTSTTGNVYGVYDMAGGGAEYVMASFDKIISESGFGSLPESKYYNLYSIDKTIYPGHALHETAGWYNSNTAKIKNWFCYNETEDNSNCDPSFSWIVRGSFSNISYASIYDVSWAQGEAEGWESSRTAIVVK